MNIYDAIRRGEQAYGMMSNDIGAHDTRSCTLYQCTTNARWPLVREI